MRVIRTEMYFEISDLEYPDIFLMQRQQYLVPSISFAWFRGPEPHVIPEIYLNIEGFMPLLAGSHFSSTELPFHETSHI